MNWSRPILINKQHGEQEAEQAANTSVRRATAQPQDSPRNADEYPRGWGWWWGWGSVPAIMLRVPIRYDPLRSIPFRYVWNDVLGGLFQINCSPRKRKGPPRVMFILHKFCPKYRSCKHITNAVGFPLPDARSRSDPIVIMLPPDGHQASASARKVSAL